MDSDLEEYNRVFMVFEIVVFNIVGNFGNVALILTTMKMKKIQEKSCILLAITAVSHIVCLLSELVNVYFIRRGTPVIRNECYPFLALYMFAISHQAVMALVIAFDLLFAVSKPVIYHKLHTPNYILLCSIPAVGYGLFVTLFGGLTADDSVITFCNPPLVLIPAVSRLWSLSNVAINAGVLLVYAAVITVVVARGSLGKKQRHVIRRLQVIATVFLLSWFMAMLGVDIVAALNIPQRMKSLLSSNMVFFALVCYSQTFYVCLWRSTDYRRAFLKQFTRGQLALKSTMSRPNYSSINGAVTV